MKTKYIKVSVSERLPEKDGRYFLWVDNPNSRHLNSKNLSSEYNMERNFFREGEFQTFYETTHYLQEVPDREDEMREMLVRMHFALTELREVDEESEIFRSIIPDEIEQLLNELKQTT